MNCLIDTHALIWYFENSSNIPKKIENIIDDNKNKKFICSTTLWEIAIKTSISKLDMKLSLNELISEINNCELTVLQIENKYLNYIVKLPFIHKDPFDRLLISIALADDLTIITADENIQKYNVKWVW